MNIRRIIFASTTVLLIILAVAFVAELIRALPDDPPQLMAPSTPPVLPAYHTPQPSPTAPPTLKLNPGDSVVLTNSDDHNGPQVWIEYLGADDQNGDQWSCSTNQPDLSKYCISYQYGDAGRINFWWGSVKVAESFYHDGVLYLMPGWHITTNPATPLLP